MKGGGSVRASLRSGTTYGDHVARYAFAARYVSGKDVLDFGCGDGYGSLLLATAGAKSVTGFDLDRKALDRARRRKSPSDAIRFEEVAEEFDGAKNYLNSFDVVVCLETIEHVKPTSRCLLLNRVRSVMRIGGTLVISAPNWQLTRRYDAVGEYPLNPFHAAEPDLKDLMQLMDESGFSISEVYGQYPTNLEGFRRAVSLSRTVVSRPLEFCLGRRWSSLPRALRHQFFRAATVIKAVRSGMDPYSAQEWEMRDLDNGDARDAVHLILVGTPSQ